MFKNIDVWEMGESSHPTSANPRAQNDSPPTKNKKGIVH